MLNIWRRIEEIEKLLQHEDITGYKIEINTSDKNYILDKPEQEQQHTNAIGFTIPNEDEEWLNFMDRELLEIKEKILKFCNRYEVKDFTVYLQQESRYIVDGKYSLNTTNVDLEVKV